MADTRTSGLLLPVPSSFPLRDCASKCKFLIASRLGVSAQARLGGQARVSGPVVENGGIYQQLAA